MKTYRISDNTDTVEINAESVKAASISYASETVVALEVTEQVYDADSDEWIDGDTHYVIRTPGTQDTDDEVGDDPSVEFVVGYGPVETDWMPLWQRQ